MPPPHLQLVRDQSADATLTLDEIACRPGAHGVFTGPAPRPGWTRVIVMDRAVGLVSHGEVTTDRLTSALIDGLGLFFLGAAVPASARERSAG